MKTIFVKLLATGLPFLFSAEKIGTHVRHGLVLAIGVISSWFSVGAFMLNTVGINPLVWDSWVALTLDVLTVIIVYVVSYIGSVVNLPLKPK